MDKRLEDRLYNRLMELAEGDGGRLMDHLQGAGNAERQAKFTERMKAEGWRRVPVWVQESDLDALRKEYPGPRGGVDWQAVLDAVLRGKNHA
jgi:hypothetical protein